MTGMTRLTALLCVTAAIGGCMDRDPYRRTDVWRPTGANAANIAAMVADPNDLIRGRGTTRTDTKAPMMAIDRVVTDRPKPLVPIGDQTGSGGGSGGGSGSGAPPSGG